MSELLNERGQVRGVLAAWNAQYPGGDPWGTAKRLAALDPETATADDVARVIGNNSWVRPHKCDECGHESWDVVRVGEAPDYESSTAELCARCLTAAVSLLSEALP